jgi:hypothetical protein
MSKFRYWLGSPLGGLVYFGIGFGLIALIFWWKGYL